MADCYDGQRTTDYGLRTFKHKETIMKRLFYGVLCVAVFAALVVAVFAQGNPRGTAELVLNGKKISLEYGRPSLRGRNVDQMLIRLRPGQFWRLGADQSTTFSTETGLTFGDVTVPKGEYSIWARKEAGNSWKLVFNKQHGQFGTEHDASQDFAAVPLTESKAADSEERLTLGLAPEGKGGVFTVRWGDLKLSATFRAS